MKKSVIAVLIACWLAPQLLAADGNELQDILTDVQSLRSEIQKNTASFLLIAKQMEKAESEEKAAGQRVQIISQTAPIRESDLATSPKLTEALEGDEFPLVEQRNEWYQVTLKDGREGWVYQGDAQLIEKSKGILSSSANPLTSDPRIRQMSERLYTNISDQYKQAQQLFKEFEGAYNDLSDTEKAGATPIQAAYQAEKEKIQTYYAYAGHYYRKYIPVQQAPVATASGREIGYEGTVSLRLGTSSYEAGVKESTTSQNLNLNGSVIFSPESRLNINLTHNNDVIQTPYTSNDVSLNFQHQTAAGTRLQASFLYNSYNDENFDRNNFQNVGGGIRIEHPLNAETRLFGDVQANSKTYEEAGGNEFQGARFNTGLVYNSSKTQANVGVRGRVQNSDISFLDYLRVIPNAGVKWLTENGNFSIRGEAEQLTYDTEAEGNNFNRGRVDLEWAGNGGSTSTFTFTAKQFPNNENFDFYKFRFQNQWIKRSGPGTGRTALSLLYVYYTQQATELTNYVDLRFDNNSSGEKGYFDFNLFGRYWEETGREHSVDMFSRFGFKFSQFQVGPAIGATLLLNPDDLQIERDGNSFRVGVDARANAAIQKATVYGNFRYQKSLVYNSEISIDTSTGLVTEGELKTRMPTTIQFSAGVQMPIIAALDLKVDVSYYNIDLDISDAVSINPINTRTGLRLLAGVSYRFQKQ